ncbi:MAG: DNA cytosine methyltransferase [Pseudomonadota bacterium]
MNLFKELIVDNFAGGGGASSGIEMATGRSVDIAINHDPDAIAMHAMNHPGTKHYCESVWDVNPREAVNGLPVGLCWLSPDCKHFSKAKGGKPVEKKIRGLAWVAVRWAATVKPRVIMLENVEEFKTWGPIVDGKPCPERKGKTFQSFVRALARQGYKVEFKELRACDYGAPTIRKRLFMVARRDGRPIVWPKPTHGKPDAPEVKSGKLKPWRTSAECIDWSIPCPSIFERKKPLAENTLKRIAKGIQKFVIDSASPFLVQTGYGERKGQSPRVLNINAHLGTVVAGGVKHALVSAFLAKHYTGVVGDSINNPTPTVTTIDHNALVTSHLIKMRGTNIGHRADEPAHTITAGGLHLGEVRAFLLKYYGTNIGHPADQPLQTITTKERFGLVTIHGVDYQIVDIGMRMLQPRELFKAQGFAEDYIIDVDPSGKPISKTKQVARCGNAVPPPFAKALVEANLPELCEIPQRKEQAA